MVSSTRERASPADARHFLVDGQFEALNQAQACKAGVDIYLAKPFDREKVAETRDRLVRRERKTRPALSPLRYFSMKASLRKYLHYKPLRTF